MSAPASSAGSPKTAVWTRDYRHIGGEICGDGFTITRVLTTSRLLLAGRAHCGDDTRHVLDVRR
ncbi:hypothetical protein ACQP2T_05410 [Nonomuraea sp. CA-143628]|uniref:hypothetical protein n=1 Tax=Nonomuraea sp. CA-143628 TaxID=3239997 RepID=UPI003D8CC809